MVNRAICIKFLTRYILTVQKLSELNFPVLLDLLPIVRVGKASEEKNQVYK
jgi:hypothetical protein